MSTSKRAEPQSFRARALQNSLTVKDLDQSLHWYHEVVGFMVDQKYEREGEVVEEDVVDSSTWVRLDGEWKCAAHTESVVPPA